MSVNRARSLRRTRARRQLAEALLIVAEVVNAAEADLAFTLKFDSPLRDPEKKQFKVAVAKLEKATGRAVEVAE